MKAKLVDRLDLAMATEVISSELCVQLARLQGRGDWEGDDQGSLHAQALDIPGDLS